MGLALAPRKGAAATTVSGPLLMAQNDCVMVYLMVYLIRPSSGWVPQYANKSHLQL
jgi:hypothetical protein